ETRTAVMVPAYWNRVAKSGRPTCTVHGNGSWVSYGEAGKYGTSAAAGPKPSLGVAENPPALAEYTVEAICFPNTTTWALVSDTALSICGYSACWPRYT